MSSPEWREEASDAVPARWRKWVAENRLRSVGEECLIKTLVENGVGEEAARREVGSLLAHPYFQVAALTAQKLTKLESLLGVYQELSERAGGVERRADLSRSEFLERYYCANRPVILTGLMRDWKALAHWNPEYLKAVCGGETVEIMSGREGDPQYEINAPLHRSRVLLGDFVDMVARGGPTNDYYLVSNNQFWKTEGAAALRADVGPLPEYLDEAGPAPDGSFWFGPAGTVTPLHHDEMNILVCQVYGRKRWTLISPNQTPLVYNEVGVYSAVDLDDPDYERHPLFGQVDAVEFTLEPGEVLFLPVGWWHHVRALDISISLSFTRFVFPNRYQWKNPRRLMSKPAPQPAADPGGAEPPA